MTRATLLTASLLATPFFSAAVAQAQAPPPSEQISAAVLAAPEDRRAGARVLGWGADGKFTQLRAGTNDMVCLADDPKRTGFEVDCYHISLEPYMARGRELLAQGVQGEARNQKRWAEAQQGTLRMPEKPAVLYTLSGKQFDPATGKVEGEYRRTTIYIPGATAESTGLSIMGSTTDPWIMFPGTPGAHIMITPPRATGGGGHGG